MAYRDPAHGSLTPLLRRAPRRRAQPLGARGARGGGSRRRSSTSTTSRTSTTSTATTVGGPAAQAGRRVPYAPAQPTTRPPCRTGGDELPRRRTSPARARRAWWPAFARSWCRRTRTARSAAAQPRHGDVAGRGRLAAADGARRRRCTPTSAAEVPHGRGRRGRARPGRRAAKPRRTPRPRLRSPRRARALRSASSSGGSRGRKWASKRPAWHGSRVPRARQGAPRDPPSSCSAQRRAPFRARQPLATVKAVTVAGETNVSRGREETWPSSWGPPPRSGREKIKGSAEPPRAERQAWRPGRPGRPLRLRPHLLNSWAART